MDIRIDKASEMHFRKTTDESRAKAILWAYNTDDWNHVTDKVDWSKYPYPWNKDMRKFFMLSGRKNISSYFILTYTLMSLEDFSCILGEMWTYLENPNADAAIPKEQFVEFFTACDKNAIMTEDEKKVFASLPEKVTVYRGVSKDYRDNYKALSWTLSFEKAEWFANRYNFRKECGATVFQATIDKKHIFAYFDGRKEQEIILNYKKLKDVHSVPFKARYYE